MCPHTTIYLASSYCYICVLIQLDDCALLHALSRRCIQAIDHAKWCEFAEARTRRELALRCHEHRGLMLLYTSGRCIQAIDYGKRDSRRELSANSPSVVTNSEDAEFASPSVLGEEEEAAVAAEEEDGVSAAGANSARKIREGQRRTYRLVLKLVVKLVVKQARTQRARSARASGAHTGAVCLLCVCVSLYICCTCVCRCMCVLIILLLLLHTHAERKREKERERQREKETYVTIRHHSHQ
jgi:hypothetical protein